MLPQHASVRDGGTGVDGISRAGLNKIVGNTFNEGMRKVCAFQMLVMRFLIV